jgi:tetratricopeptide (TPR) repeat protein
MNPKILATALSFELSALYTAIDFGDSTAQLLLFFSAHAAASALLALFALPALPRHYREPRAVVLAFLFSFSFFIPLIGLLGVMLAVFVALLKPRLVKTVPFASVRQPEFLLSVGDAEPQLRKSGLRSVLLDQTTPAQVRLKSLLTLQNMPARTAGPMLRKLLSDPADDIRLVAYGMLDMQEKRINARTQEELQKLERAAEPEARANCLRHLAELHWELVYTGLVQGDVREHALESALHYVEQGLEIAGHDPGLWYLRARLLQASGRLEEARGDFSVAVSCGLPEARALPYVAELAFERRDFAAVRDVMALVARSHVSPLMAPLVSFWRSDDRAGTEHA